MARFTAEPIAPDEESTRSSAGDTRSKKITAPSAPSSGSLFATRLISATASFTRLSAGCDFQPNARRRKRDLNVHTCFVVGVVTMSHRAMRGTRRSTRHRAVAALEEEGL